MSYFPPKQIPPLGYGAFRETSSCCFATLNVPGYKVSGQLADHTPPSQFSALCGGALVLWTEPPSCVRCPNTQSSALCWGALVLWTEPPFSVRGPGFLGLSSLRRSPSLFWVRRLTAALPQHRVSVGRVEWWERLVPSIIRIIALLR